MSPPDPAPVDGDALDVLDLIHDDLERIEALAHVVLEGLQDVRFDASSDGARVGNRRFGRLIGLLADACEDARVNAGEELERLTHARVVEVTAVSRRQR